MTNLSDSNSARGVAELISRWVKAALICRRKGHDWRPTSPMYSDGWTRECKRCGKEDSVTR